MTTRPPIGRRLTTAVAIFGALATVWGASRVSGEAAPLPTGTASPLARPTTTTPTASTPTAPAKATVTQLVDARTVLTSAGERVVVAGLAPPGPCWSAEALDFATTALLGTDVDLLNAVPAQQGGLAASLRLPDGSDYALTALLQGMAKPAVTAPPPFHAAATAAGAAEQGLWGQPCLGTDALPVRFTPPAATPTTAPPPKATTARQAGPPHPYYRNCAAVHAAGAGPLLNTSPGYRRALDRNHNGIACEN